jgi:uncharacterized NAD(P)/FAD-binding protein YdhS
VITDLQSTEPGSLPTAYDVAIIGAGISSAYTLIHYIALLEQQSQLSQAAGKEHRAVKIVVTEKSSEFWTGIPYGSRSGANALLISPLNEFIPQQLERAQFISWLNENRDWIFDPQKYTDGELAGKWRQANDAAIDRGDWDRLFISRQTFGIYLKQQVANSIERATANGLIKIDLLVAEVQDVIRMTDRYQVDFTPAAATDNTSFLAEKIVLAIGSPPNIAFEHDLSSDVSNDICYINDMYEPTLDANIHRICQSLQTSNRPSHRQVTIVGSNASTLDILYALNNSPAAVSLIEKFIIISPNAAFPHRINFDIISGIYSPAHLLALVKTESFTAKQILTAVEQDVAAATADNINISDIYSDISKLVIQALNQLNVDEQKQFVCKYAVEIGKLQRRAGAEYLDVVDRLVAQGKLEFIKGKFVKCVSRADSDAKCEYIDGKTQVKTVLDAPVGVVINCAGFQDVTKSSSILIQNLIRRNICMPNDSKRGFTIDKKFEMSKNCYLMGPLVAGNIDGDFKIWHAESCQRIINLSKQLAEALISSTQLDPAQHPAQSDLSMVMLTSDVKTVEAMAKA